VARSAPSSATGPARPASGLHDLNAKLRTRNAAAKDEALAVVRRKNAELAKLAETAAEEAERLLANAKRAIRKAKADAARRRPRAGKIRPPDVGGAG
jgi:hypothetical protein